MSSSRSLALLLGVSLGVFGCGSEKAGTGDSEDDTNPIDVSDAGTGNDENDGEPAEGDGEPGPQDGDPGPGDGAEGDGSEGDGEPGPNDELPVLPTPSISCPEFTNGTLAFGDREAQVWINEQAAAEKDGPVVFYWYGTFGVTSQAEFALGAANIKRITDAGGIVVGPKHAGTGQFPWLDGGTEDYELSDEVVACAQEKIGIDAKHIHSFGMSAGGIFTSKLSFARSNYLASVVTWSGGDEGTFADPSNKFAAMVYHGGTRDNAFGHDFVASSVEYADALRAAGHFVLVCDHGGGHSFPTMGGDMATTFFLDNGFGESPYAVTLPDSVPDYCNAE